MGVAATGVGLAMGAVAMVFGGCSSASGCEGFDTPSSQRRDVGERVDVTIDVFGTQLGQLNFAGGYWMTDTTLAVSKLDEVDGVAVLTSARVDARGEVIEGAVSVDLGSLGVVDYTGPIGCM